MTTLRAGSEPEVTLIDFNPYMLELVYLGWHQVKGDGFPEPKTLQQIREEVPRYQLEGFFKEMLHQWPHVMEWPYFVWRLDKVSRAFCAQLERKRIGVAFFEKSLMTFSAGDFADEELFTNTISDNPEAQAEYLYAMHDAQRHYNRLRELGEKIYDARGVLPLHVCTRLFMGINLRAFVELVHKRNCWVIHHSYWQPVLAGMRRELLEKVGPVLDELFEPPCIASQECICPTVMEERAKAEIRGDVCPIYIDAGYGSGPFRVTEEYNNGLQMLQHKEG